MIHEGGMSALVNHKNRRYLSRLDGDYGAETLKFDLLRQQCAAQELRLMVCRRDTAPPCLIHPTWRVKLEPDATLFALHSGLAHCGLMVPRASAIFFT